MIGPGRDTNYPTSSGDATRGILAQQFTLNGFHVSVGVIALIILALIVYNMARKRR